jgi:N-6 DNA methylase
LYSSFLKYALGDGKELGIVLTPPYTTKMMCEMIGIDSESRVLDLTTGSAGFLISAMEMMIEDTEKKFAKGSTEYKNKVAKIKSEQLLGVEKNIKMYTLAATNMILRGDGSSNILLGDSVEMFQDKYTSFNANKFLLNPPFSKDENGMFFFEH